MATAAVALVALAASPASAQLVAIGDGTNPAAPTICPGDTLPVQVNTFTLSHATSAIVAGVRLKFTSADATSLVSLIQVRQGGSVIGSVVPTASGANVTFGTRLTIGPTPTVLTIWAVPKAAGAMPDLSSALAFGIFVESTISSYSSGPTADASSVASLDTVPDPEVAFTGISAAGSTIGLWWKGAPYVLVLRSVGGPVTDRPSNGSTYPASGTLGSSTIVAAGALNPVTGPKVGDSSGLTAGKPYYYRVFTKDACGNWSAGMPVGPVYLGAHTEGDRTVGSVWPMVGILNPLGGVVTPPFRVQARVFSPGSQAISTVSLELDDGVNPPTMQPLYVNTSYGSTATSGVYEVGPFVSGNSPGLNPATGKYTIRVQATNALGNVWSAPVGLVVTGGTGDGNLLVRDNSSQLCSDCHAVKTHSSEELGNDFGSWYVGCRGCHTPHGTTNASLISTEIQPPAVNKLLPPSKVQFSKRTGFFLGDAATSPQDASYANTTSVADASRRTGPCQVCHTRTQYYQGTANPAEHYTGTCATCHAHTSGFAGTGCTGCHGTAVARTPRAAGADALLDAAPPVTPPTITAPFVTGGGVHLAHVNKTTFRTAALPCSSCHEGYAHSDGDIDLGWSDLASTGVSPTPPAGTTTAGWVAAPSCTNFCHGATLTDGFTPTKDAVSWGTPKVLDCGSCHGFPPNVSPHTSGMTDCTGCHPDGYTSTPLTAATHIDGTVNFVAGGCTGCHGGTKAVVAAGASQGQVDAMPPKDALDPRSDLPTDPGVGAHVQHANSNTSLAAPLPCNACHQWAAFPTDVTHKDGASPMAVALNWNPVTKSCNIATCHGTATPVWIQVDGSFKTCSSCHGVAGVTALPPVTTNHPQNPTCNNCHSGYGTNTVVRATHVDGSPTVNTAPGGCARCHGTLLSGVAATSIDAAPGVNSNVDSKGNPASTTTLPAVGAHKAHLQPRYYNGVIACTQCHPSPSYGDATHANGAAAVPFATGTLARTQLPGDAIVASPAYASPSCNNTYCHGEFTGGTRTDLAWTGAALAGTSMTCTSCHGNPPLTAPGGRAHPNNSNCGSATCHGSGYSNSNVLAPALAKHMNGTVDYTALSCTSCHGDVAGTVHASVPGADANQRAAPPNDSTGASSGAQVGQHLAHVNMVDATSPPYACLECHTGQVPVANLHADGLTAITTANFGTIAKTGGVSPSMSGSNCSNTYCHGNFQGGKNAIASWTGTALGCDACHGNPPIPAAAAGGVQVSYHPNNATCQTCHPAAYTRTGATTGTVDVTTHVRGSTTLQANRTGCVACHGTPGLVVNEPAIADPNVAGAPSTDAHVAHVNPVTATKVRSPVHCTECHGADKTDKTHADNNSLPIWGPLANGTILGGANTNPSYSGGTCTNTYCHGARVAGGGLKNPAWTSGAAARGCGACHGNPPLAVFGTTRLHPNRSDCTTADCHGAGYAGGGITATTHIDGKVDVSPTLSCTSCHGSATLHPSIANADARQTAAPPLDSTGASSGGTQIGAHLTHVNKATATNPPYACVECHTGQVPGTNLHADGSTTITAANFGTIAKTGLLSPSMSGSNCSNTYCHGNFEGGKNATPAWTGVAIGCDSCHGNPPVPAAAAGGVPASYHPNDTTCGRCHPAAYTRTGATTGTVDPTTHARGDGAARTATTGCAQCHGKLKTDGVAATSTDAAPGVAVGSFDAHGNASTATTTLGVGAHKAHLVAGGLKAVALGCSDCHPTYGDRTHANNTAAWSWGSLAISRGRTAVGIGYAAGTCSNTYCHAGPSAWDGDPVYAGSDTSPTWTAGNKATVCGSCHKIAPAGGSHAIPETQNCKVCHGDPYDCVASSPGTCTVGANNAMHMNGTQDVPNSTCFGCHGTTGADVPDFVIGNATPSKVNTSAEWTSFGHGRTNATFNEFTGSASNERCAYCHDPATAQHKILGNPYRLRGSVQADGATFNAYSALSAKNGNEVCLNCHDVSATVAYGVDPDGIGTLPRVCQASGANACDTKATAWHAGADHTATDGGRRCWDCHDPHGDLTNIKMIGKDLLVSASDDHGFAGTRTPVDVVFTATTAVSNYVKTAAPRDGVCQACHTQTSYWRQTSEPTAHHTSIRCVSCHDHDFTAPATAADAFKGTGDCTVCHATAQPMAVAINGSTTRRPIVPEFKSAWSHKASTSATPANRTVSKEDCTACHMEGMAGTGLAASPGHADGYVDLRDPDTGTTIMEVQWLDVPAGAGAYSNKTPATPSRFPRFQRNLTSNVLEEPVKAIMINQCLKCHDSNGAAHTNARVPTGTAGKPFATTIGVGNTYYNGTNGLTACTSGTNGCVTNIDASFATTNASYHPIKGKQNNSYTGGAQMVAPWNTTKTANTLTSWGALLSCWDCHSSSGASGTQTSTVTAHGGGATLRSPIWASNATAAGNLCRVCHFAASTTRGHGTGSAGANVDSNATPYMGGACSYCHLSSVSKPLRPIPAQDAHGFDAFAITSGTPSLGTTDKMWPFGATESYRPYAFMRNVGPRGAWKTTYSWKPRSGPGVPAGSATCSYNTNTDTTIVTCNNGHTTYGPGGVY